MGEESLNCVYRGEMKTQKMNLVNDEEVTSGQETQQMVDVIEVEEEVGAVEVEVQELFC